MLLRFLAYFSVRAARRLDRKRFARKYMVATEAARFRRCLDRLFPY